MPCANRLLVALNARTLTFATAVVGVLHLATPSWGVLEALQAIPAGCPG